MKREEMLARVEARTTPWDIVIIGGGATGMGIAVDAATRGYDVLLLEREDFGKATSSRSTKLVHGGVRYLEQGNVSLVMEALKERGLLRQNAPHLVTISPLSCPATPGGRRRSMALGSRSTTCSPANTASADRAFFRAKRRSNVCPIFRPKD